MTLMQDSLTEPQAETPTEPTYTLGTWDLSDLLPDAEEGTIAKVLADLDEEVAAFEARREQLHEDMEPELFREILHQYERLHVQMDIPRGYAHLWFSSNTLDSRALSFRNRMRQVLAKIANRVLFFSLWWKGLDDTQAERLMPRDEDALDDRAFLDELRRFSPYTLDERSEQIINVKNANGIGAVVTLYSMLTNRLEFELEIDGEKRLYNDDEMRGFFYATDPDVRAASFLEMFRVYERESQILAQIYANRVRDWHEEWVVLRGSKSPISIRNLSNDVSDEAVDTLLGVVRDNAVIFRDYFQLKAGWLGMSDKGSGKLRRFDLYAPLNSAEKRIPYDEAIDSVLSTFDAFHPKLSQLSRRVFDQRHIDGEIRKGKRGGAFCATLLPGMTPYVHMNYTGRVRDVATLAHELGHAMHSMLAEDHSIFTQHPSLCLAETASVFSEMLMTDQLLSKERDPLVRRELLAAAVDDIYATVMRQAYFVRFEIDAHEAVMQNKTADDLCDLYMENLREQFGDSLELAPEFRYEWVSIPHLYNTPFYCYAYSFGQLLVLALYRRYQQEGEAFKPGYLRLLSQGGTGSPADLLSEMGIDITDAAFWQEGFEVVKDMIAELESISAEV